MLQYVKFFYDIYQSAKDPAEKKALLRMIIKNEARLNNDIANVIYLSDPKKVAANNPELFLQFETNSFELLTTLGLHSHEVFDDKEYVSEENLGKLSNKPDYYKNRSQSELYEFYIRKTKLLIRLSRSNAISSVNVRLTARIQNIKYATRFLSAKLK